MSETAKKTKPVAKATETYSTAMELQYLIGNMKNKGISVESLVSTVKLKESIKASIKQYHEAQQALMEKYGVKPGPDSRYEYGEHKDKEKIIEDLAELAKQEVTIGPLNYMPLKELAKATEDVSLDIVSALASKIGQK